MGYTGKTGCVMVLYNHQPDSLKKGIGSLLSQFDMLVLVDNTPGRDDSDAFADDRDRKSVV